MKFLLLVSVLLSGIYARSQSIKDKEWVKIQATRKDGSRIIDRLGSDTASSSYYFIGDSAYIGTFHQYSYKEKYLIQDNVISIGSSLKYQIDSVDEVYLFLSQLSANNLPDDKLNSYAFINSDYLFDYLLKNQKITMEGDSEIVCNDFFCPTFNGDIFKLLESQFPFINSTNSIEGSLVLTPTGDVHHIRIDTSNKFSNKEISGIIKTVYETAGSWIMPPTPKPFLFRIPFNVEFLSDGRFSAVQFVLSKRNQNKTPTKEQLASADRHFDNGTRFFNRQKFQDAIDEFKLCIAIDPNNVDAYYDLGYAYQNNGNSDLSCKIWKQLSEMGQRKGEEIYNTQCK